MTDTLPKQDAEELAHQERKRVIASRNDARNNRVAELIRIIGAARRELQQLQNEGLG